MSYRNACLHCSLSDKELNEYIQEKMRAAGDLPLKCAVSHVGLQEDGTWVVGENGYFSTQGESIPMALYLDWSSLPENWCCSQPGM